MPIQALRTLPSNLQAEFGIPSQDSCGYILVVRMCEREHAEIHVSNLPVVR